MSDRMPDSRLEWWRKYVPAEAMEELERARTREAELERWNAALILRAQQAETDKREANRDCREAQAKSAALEREVERLRDIMAAGAAPLAIDGPNHAATVQHLRAALSPPKETP